MSGVHGLRITKCMFAVSVMVQCLPAIITLLLNIMEFYNIFAIFVMLFRKTQSGFVVCALVG